MDNLSAAVVSIGKGAKRTYTEPFSRFQCHYGFEVQPCNPASGYEKGHVEKKVGYTRNNLFTTAPLMEDFPQLADWLQEEMRKDQHQASYPEKIEEKHTPDILLDYETDLNTYDQRLCPSLRGGVFS